jgi:hypothetical protein
VADRPHEFVSTAFWSPNIKYLYLGSALGWLIGIAKLRGRPRSKMQQYTKVGGAQFWEKLERELGRAADPAYDIPPEKKRKLLSQIHVLVERWRPFMAEIAPLFADFQRPPSVEDSRSGK